ncbi:hypothetical protein CBS147339_6457 [Penicillium roqueforti]|uniref:uncharacterized protein n=1 Tax=Penicillium roqueforti TaxID=5082 RepID=UPI001909DEED|nr:uncharacterized protein LCP9604111_5233 [Penicillium roqueforti]KAF9248483.1 hypothetical protein LCP9604111_5233 [Penicillium roqueforti]KAI2674080.1 hypothetical protein CBS147355_7255 [Penicillium roqueforti]KAI2699289.1 hypothetical protein CBS147372_6536 [Penicillium roqueforti]KAI2770571.1 hypothetical protein DTO012A8_4590 [Penicillium roqueforti]KAI3073032.1 hypothetical protein CBS147339_6457 [Penicillium roqueforti]
MGKKSGKKNKKGSKPVAAVESAKDVVEPEQTEGQTATEQTAPETATQPTETVAEPSKAPEATPVTEAATEIPAVAETKDLETKEAVKAEQAPATEGTVEETVEKVQASKAGQLGELDDGATAGTVLPETITREPASLDVLTGAPATLVERPKTSDSNAPAVAAPVPIAAPAETDAAHTKRPYEKPIFTNEDNLKPHKMPKTDEEAIQASVAEDKKTIETLAGVGPATAAALTTPEPEPVQAEAPKAVVEQKETPVVVEAPKVEEKKVEAPKVEEKKAEAPKKVEEKKVEEKKAEEKKAEEKIPVSTHKTTPAQAGAPSSPVAVAAANAAILASKGDKAAAPAATPVVSKEAEPKKPEAALKRGDEAQPEEALPKAEEPKPETKTEAVKEEAAKAQQDTHKTSESGSQAEKKKGGFMSWLKRKFK